jgi:hypothetical protein
LNSNVAGACGEIAAYKGKNWSALLNPLGKSFALDMFVGIIDYGLQSPPRTLSTKLAIS